jgi:hypothetical protein
MTIFDEILIAANQIANEGSKPTVALIKAKLTQRVPLPTIIQTLKSWQHDPLFIKLAVSEKQLTNVRTSNSEHISISDLDEKIKNSVNQALANELFNMKEELSDMKKLIKALTEQLK